MLLQRNLHRRRGPRKSTRSQPRLTAYLRKNPRTWHPWWSVDGWWQPRWKLRKSKRRSWKEKGMVWDEGHSTWICYHLCRVNMSCYSWFMFRGPDHLSVFIQNLACYSVTLNMFSTMKTWITFIIHIEGPIRSYKVFARAAMLYNHFVVVVFFEVSMIC